MRRDDGENVDCGLWMTWVRGYVVSENHGFICDMATRY